MPMPDSELTAPYTLLFCAAAAAKKDLEDRNYGRAEKTLSGAIERAEAMTLGFRPEVRKKLEELREIALDKGLFQC